MKLASTITTSALAIAGAGLWSFSGSQLASQGKFEAKPNPLGLKMSPYGQVIAMAFQTPIDRDWHGGIEVHDVLTEHDHGDSDGTHGHDHGHDHSGCSHEHGLCEHSDCDHDHGAEATGLASHAGDGHSACSHNHAAGDCGGCGHEHGANSVTADMPLLDRLTRAVKTRTNPNPPSPGHQWYIRRELEKKLRFAYELDPSHYANYNSYHLFLVQPSLGTSGHSAGQSREAALKLAENTMRYCLREQVDPRPSLTAASAAYNIIEIMFLNEEHYSIDDMRRQLEIIDFCMGRHLSILEKSLGSGVWEGLSQARQSEVVDRQRFTLKLRDTAEKTILRLEGDEEAATVSVH